MWKTFAELVFNDRIASIGCRHFSCFALSTLSLPDSPSQPRYGAIRIIVCKLTKTALYETKLFLRRKASYLIELLVVIAISHPCAILFPVFARLRVCQTSLRRTSANSASVSRLHLGLGRPLLLLLGMPRPVPSLRASLRAPENRVESDLPHTRQGSLARCAAIQRHHRSRDGVPPNPHVPRLRSHSPGRDSTCRIIERLPDHVVTERTDNRRFLVRAAKNLTPDPEEWTSGAVLALNGPFGFNAIFFAAS